MLGFLLLLQDGGQVSLGARAKLRGHTWHFLVVMGSVFNLLLHPVFLWLGTLRTRRADKLQRREVKPP